jgi:hypothetical protein
MSVELMTGVKMKRGRIEIAAGLLIITLLVGCINSGEDMGGKKISAGEPTEHYGPEHFTDIQGIKWKVYESPEGGFRIKYPADWKIEEDSSRDVGFSCKIDESPYVKYASIRGGVESFDRTNAENIEPSFRGKSLWEVAEKARDEMKKINEETGINVIAVEISNITLDGKPAVKEIEEIYDTIFFANMMEISIISRDQENYYFISSIFITQGPKQPEYKYWLYDEYLPVVEQIINSFEFL